MDISEKLKEINQQLEKVSIRQKGGKLYLRGRRDDSFPPKPGDAEPRRVEVALDCSASPAGLKIARLKALEIDAQLQWGKFNWKDSGWLKNRVAQSETVKYWVEKFTTHYWENRPKTPSAVVSFEKNRVFYLGKLPQDKPLSLDLLRETAIARAKPQTRSRQGYCVTYRMLAKFLQEKGVISEEEFEAFKKDVNSLGQYTPNAVDPNNLPSDDQIIEIWRSIPDENWQWVYGMLASYGLRLHELYKLDLDRFNRSSETLIVLDDTKTGRREAYPCPASWRERFELWDVKLPTIKGIEELGNMDVGNRITKRLQRFIPHNPYALRHAWCIRTGLMGVPDAIAAKWAGHSVEVRLKTYHQAIKRQHHQQAFEDMKRKEEESFRRL